jgi:hypothetical protein
VLRIRDVYPGYLIPDPTPATKEKGENFFVLPFLVATNITKFKIIKFELIKKKFLTIDEEL